ncbi:MAG: circularly permuted type 2 ATP-grasp protein [Fibrobacteres bacterium]|nr:circularly permuted type 2 ATP-grasp protein [Fibrobacterota bacterium]
MRLNGYDPGAFYDEMFSAPGRARPSSDMLVRTLESMPDGELARRQTAAEKAFLDLGITFNVYNSQSGLERIFPFDVLPRILDGGEWAFIEKGLRQRIHALNLFLDDIYHDQRIVKDGVVPLDLIRSAKGYRKECQGLNPPWGIWCHITGTDLVKDGDGKLYVLEDNIRCPSGVSYVIGNRQVMKRTFPQIFASINPRPVEDYPSRLLDMLQFVAPRGEESPCVAILTPGVYNSAYFEHSFLAQQMGVELVTGADLAVRDGLLWMRTTRGYKRVDVLYRRIDDDFLDPKAFRPDSLLGVPGLMEVYRNGKLGLANAPGTGVADDKVIYAYVPKIIRYYLGEEILLPNVETYMCWVPEEMKYVLEHMHELVIKTANDSGGYGVLIGPHSSKAVLSDWAARIVENPRNFIAQRTLSLSRSPVMVGDSCEGRHVDLRPFVLYGRDIYVMPGGLTRVALKKGSLVVNSSQGGGSKDTWVLPISQGASMSQSMAQSNGVSMSQTMGIPTPDLRSKEKAAC